MSAPQADLLTWQPPQPVARFEERAVRASNFGGRLSRGIAIALAQATSPREEIAERMSAFLGARVSVNMLNAYASAAASKQSISAERLAALLQATRDRRLLEVLAEPMGWAVIERKYLPLIELAAVRDREAEMKRLGDTLQRQARREGIL